MKYDISHAITDLYGPTKFVLKGVKYSGLEWYDERPKPSEEQIQAKIAELEAAEPLRLLRIQRNQLLQQTDCRFRSDLTPSQEWIDYCQALRDLPANSEPQLDENGNLTNVTWPTKPGENT